MYTNHKFIKLIVLSSFVISSLYLNMANSGILNVFNDNEDDIKIQVFPEPAVDDDYTYCWKCIAGQCTQCLKHNVSLDIPPQAFRGINAFTVRGTTGGFLFNGECRNLSVLKNYEIHFLNDYIGTSCVSREI
jgi:hypothetical protein